MNKSEMELETGQEGYDVGYKEGFSDGQKAVSNINQLMKEAHDNVIKRGLYSSYPKNDVYKKLQEEVREFGIALPSTTFHKDSEQSEISDIILVLLAYCGEMGYDIEQDIIKKIAFNKERK